LTAWSKEDGAVMSIQMWEVVGVPGVAYYGDGMWVYFCCVVVVDGED
jgi:hypothetical protein